MATIGNTGRSTLIDIAKSFDPNGSTAKVVELLNQSNEVLTDMTWIEGNLPTGHRTTIRTGLPVPTWRRLYQGVPPSKSLRAQVDEACGMLEARNEIDVDAANLNGNTAEFRLSEAQAELEGMNQTLSTALFYESQTVNAERITGLAPRYNSLAANNAQNIIDAGGVGSNNSSIWLVVWGPNTVTGIYPKGSTAGLTHQDLGEIDAFDANQNRYRALAEIWKWKCGLSVRDWRYAVRIANIDMTALAAGTGTQAITANTSVIKTMIRAMARIPQMGMGNPVFYANRTVKEYLNIQALDRSQNAIAIMPGLRQFSDSAGFVGMGSTTTFFGVPVRTVDSLLSTEQRVF